MIFRNDSDAAFARLDAVEAENAKLLAENAELRRGVMKPVKRKLPKRELAVGGIASVAAACIAVGFYASPAQSRSKQIDEKVEKLAASPDVGACLRTLVLDPHLDADSADPRVHGHDAAHIVLRVTGCQNEIAARLSQSVISSDERRALEHWQVAEQELQPVTSLVVTYYNDNPFALDSYATAPQLWREYNRALDKRNAAIEEWRVASR